ncbi:MAG: large conductance mechanosensitive channel protein MscL [Myxococcota bacterium]|nr:large conductance mechanosensitive channel protein MscL [Myxococcota bacterium]MDW8362899.1 large conductance mechanosensitive channel protein MscL [Myxococcales bacterium]
MLTELKRFILRGNVLDLAVGVIVGAAFGKVVSGVVDDLVMPVISLLLPDGDWRVAGWTLAERGPAGPEGDVVLRWGHLLSAVVDFLIIAVVLFFVVRAANRLFTPPPAPPAPPSTRDCPACLEPVPIAATRCKHCTSTLEPAR